VRRLLPALLTTVAVALAGAVPAAEAQVLDQTSSSGSGGYTVIGDTVTYAQTFRPGHDGRLVRLHLYVTSVGNVLPLRVQIRPAPGNVPGEKVLAEQLLASAPSSVDLDFAKPAAVRQDATYALVITSATSSGGVWRWNMNNGEYSRGDFVYRLGSMGSWTVSGFDLGFRTFMNAVPGDTAPPTTTVTPATAAAPSGWWRGPLTVTVKGDDGPGVGVDETRCWVNAPTPPASFGAPGTSPCPTVLTDGEHTVHTASIDGFEQAEAPQARTFRVDGTAPSTTVSGIASGRTVAPQEITLSAGDAGGSGIAATHYEIGPDPPAPTAGSPVYDPADKPVLQDGERIRFASTDRAGNVEPDTTSVPAQVGVEPRVVTVEVPGPVRTETRTVTVPQPGPEAAEPATTTLSARARDLLGSGHRFSVTVGCGRTACRATVTPEIRVGRRVVARLKPVTATVAAGKAKRVRFALTKAQRAKLSRSARVRVTVRTEGAAAPSVTLG